MKIFHRMLKEESGQNLIEYALIASIVGLAAIVSLDKVQSGIINVWITGLTRAYQAFIG